LLNPLAVGVTIGGKPLDFALPLPKLRAGHTHEFSLLSKRVVTRTVPGIADAQGCVGASVAGGGQLGLGGASVHRRIL
jgi:hypothetical protein